MQTWQKIINRYLAKAYQVYIGDKPYAVIAKITKVVAFKTGYQENTNIVIKKTVFDHFSKHFVDRKTKLIDRQKLFLFVKTLNTPNEIHLSKDGKLRYFKVLTNLVENEVIIKKDTDLASKSQVITQFENNLLDKRDLKYSSRQKNTSLKVFFDSGGAPTDPSSNMLSQVPGIGSRLPRSSESIKDLISLNLKSQNQKTNKGDKNK